MPLPHSGSPVVDDESLDDESLDDESLVDDESLDDESSLDEDESPDEDEASDEDSPLEDSVALEDSLLVVGSGPDVSGSMPDELSVVVAVPEDSLLPAAVLDSEPSVSTGVLSLGQPASNADTSTLPTRGSVQFMRTTVPAAGSVGKRAGTSSP